MTKRDFIDRVCMDVRKKEFDVTIGEARWWTEFIIDELMDMIMDSDKLMIGGLGTFEKRQGKSFIRSDFKGGYAPVQEHMRLKFTPSRAIKIAVKRGMDAEQYREWEKITTRLKHGIEVPGWKLERQYAARADE